MAKEHTKDLLKFLKPLNAGSVETALWLRDFAWDLFPDANELIYDNYNAVAWGWSVNDKLGGSFCSIAVYRTNGNVHFGFYRGNELADPQKLLLGQGNQYRYILVKDKKDFPAAYITQLAMQGYVNALARQKIEEQTIKGKTIVKSVSPVQRSLKNKTGKR